jgi:hypothetical protein
VDNDNRKKITTEMAGYAGILAGVHSIRVLLVDFDECCAERILPLGKEWRLQHGETSKSHCR